MSSRFTALVGADPETGELSPSVMIGDTPVAEALALVKQAYDTSQSAILVAESAESAAFATVDSGTAELISNPIAGPNTRAAGDARWAPRPVWAVPGKTFDIEAGLYNFGPRSLPTYRRTLAGLIAGTNPLHIAVLGDSTTHRATDSDPAMTAGGSGISWPARMRDQMLRTLGLTSGGTGIIHLWNTIYENVTEPRIVRVQGGVGHVTDLPAGTFGPYINSVVEIITDYPANGGTGGGLVRFTPSEYCTELLVYVLGSGTRTRIHGTAPSGLTGKWECAAYYGENFTPADGYTAVALEDGYVRTDNPGISGGLCVARIILPGRSDGWVFEIRSTQPGATYLAAVETRDPNAGGLRVSNIAQAGMDLNSLVGNSSEADGYKGMPIAVDAAKAQLFLIALGLNDWQGHRSVANYKNQLRTLVQRCRQTGPTGMYGHGTGCGADVVLIVQPLPNYATNPPDHIQDPPLLDYWRALYEISDELDVPVIDQAWRWTDHSTSVLMFRDGIHPNRIGAADLGLAVANALTRKI